jgi:uncharacterized protein YyaL (SSP411 family)
MKSGTQPNKLISEKSPYLLQHAYNPVQWYPWGDEAIQKARTEDKPIFLSVGYSTCHWCHVMEKESFEDDAIAGILNEHFVCMKVDREERPDVDRIYMSALQAMGQGGGWPMSMFLTPDLKPFWGGTYFPPASRYGRAGFPDILRRVNDIWVNERAKVTESAGQLTAYLTDLSQSHASGHHVGTGVADTCFEQLARTYDASFGGFGEGSKFPRPVVFSFLLRHHHRTGTREARDMVEETLRRMAAGGIYDHIGGGFHRYAVDREWRVPHFEKMLYDQAQMIYACSELHQLTHDGIWRTVVRETADYVLGTMTHAEGGFFSAEDADSPQPDNPEENGEGAFYLWTRKEIGGILGGDADLFCHAYGVEESGNAPFDPQQEFTGRNILYLASAPEEVAREFGKSAEEVEAILSRSRRRLFEVREARPRPHRDDKILTSWNGLMVAALAKASQSFGERRFARAAEKAAAFVLSHLADRTSGRLLRRFRDGEARFEAHLEDYAFFVQGLLDLYEATGRPAWLREAYRLTVIQNELFRDGVHGGFYDTAGNDPTLLVRIREQYDGAEPTGNSVAALNLLRLAEMTNNQEWKREAERVFDSVAPTLEQRPMVMPQMAAALDFSLSKPLQIVLAARQGDPEGEILARQVFDRFLPNKVVLHIDGGDAQKELATLLPFVEGLTMQEGRPTAYVCRDYVCALPTTDPHILAGLLAG